MSGEIPYEYVGIMHIDNMDEFMSKDAPSKKFQDFIAKWQPMVSGAQTLIGEEIY